MSAATAEKQELNDKFTEDVKKSANQADDIDENDEMEHKEEIEHPSIATSIKDKAETIIHKVADCIHRITDIEPHKEGQINKKEPPIGAHDQDAAEYYAERASEKYDSENSSLSSSRNRKK